MRPDLLTILTLAGTLAMSAAQASAAIDYATPGASHVENFDSLASSGSTATYANNSTIPGFYAFRSGASNAATGRSSGSVDNVAPASWAAPTTYVPFTTSTTGSRLNAYGTTGSSERAIGPLAGSTAGANPGDWFFGFAVRNTTGAPLDAFTLAYTGEQWVQAASPLTSPQRIRFDYLVTPSFDAATANEAFATQSGFGAYTAVPALDFNSLQNVATAASAIDGNAASNRASLSQTVTASIPAGSYVLLRFFDDDDNGNDNGMGIDDLTFSASAGPVVPEPATLAAAVLAAGVATRRARRKQS